MKTRSVDFLRRNREFLLLVILGVFIRFLLMPFSVHADLLSATWRESLYAFGGNFRVTGVFSEFLLSFYLKAVAPHVIELTHLFRPEFFTTGSINSAGYDFFVNSIHAARLLTILKLPFLFADLIFLFFAAKMFPDRARKTRMIAFWALNPLILYSVYAWGRYEIFGVLMTFLALYFAYRNKSWWSVIFLGLAIAFRTSYILLLPFLVLFLSKDWKDNVKYFVIGLVLMFLINHLITFLGGGNILLELNTNDTYKLFFSDQIGNDFTATSILPILYMVVLILFYREKERSFIKLINYSTVALLVYLGFGYFNPHYPVWIAPLLMIIYAQNKKILLPMLGLFASYYIFIEAYYTTAVSWQLLAPLNASFFSNLSSPVLNHFLNVDRSLVISILHTPLVFFCGLLAFILLKSKDEVKAV